MMVTISIYLFTFLTSLVIAFQACLAFGMPWGAASMGGKYPGKYPPKMRFVGVLNSFILLLVLLLFLSRAHVLLPEFHSFSRTGIWFIVAFFTLGTILNTITPSKIERIWAPVALLQAMSALIIGLN
jgi:hypothetical protein